MVDNLEDNIVIDISVDSSVLNVESFSLPMDNSENLYFHSFRVRSNDSVLSILIDPGELDRKLEVYIKYGDFPTTVNFDWNTTIPHEAMETIDNSALKAELEHRVFLTQEYVRQHGPGTYYIGLRAERT